MEKEVSIRSTDLSDDYILHSAARILKQDIEKITIVTDEYPSAGEASLTASMDRIPLFLSKFICWLLDSKSFNGATELADVPFDKLRKIMAIVECSFSVSMDFYLHLFTLDSPYNCIMILDLDN